MLRTFLLLLVFFCFLFLHSSAITAQGYSQFTCADYADRKFNEVCFPTTHNSFNYLVGPQTFIYPNQKYDIPRQLEDGIRGFMIDIHHIGGGSRVYVYHKYSILGYQTLASVLDYFNDFLSANPKEICTIIFDCDVSESSDVARVFDKHPVMKYVFHKDPSASWPTLAEMQEKEQRLVVFSHCAAYSDWYLHQNDHCFENDYNNHRVADYQCRVIRGDISKPLFIMNHFQYGWLTRRIKNKRANQYQVLMDHAQKCSEALHHIPNFLTVDWYDKGDLFRVVRELNLKRN